MNKKKGAPAPSPFKKEAKLKKKNIERKKCQIEIDEIVWGGKGIGRVDGKVFFVPKSAPQDKLLINIKKEKKDFGEGEIDAILRPSPFRISPICKDFKRCGGCQLQMIDYEKQIEVKSKIIQSILRRWLDKAKFNEIVKSTNPFQYRHSGEFHIVKRNNETLLGFFELESHRIVDFENCYLFTENFNKRIKKIRTFFRNRDTRPINFIRVSSSEDDSHFIAVIRLRDEVEDYNCYLGLKEEANLNGVIILDKYQRVAVSEGDTLISYTIYKKNELIEKDITFKIDPRNFTQAHYFLNQLLVEEVIKFLNPLNHESILELFSGVGNFTLPIALKCKEIVAIEQSELAVTDSKINAELHSIYNIQHIREDVKKYLPKLVSSAKKIDSILLDPPRGGAIEVLDYLTLLNPKKIVYVSCNLPTLERDLGKLSDLNYTPKEFSFFDLFPQTYGIESVVLLQKE